MSSFATQNKQELTYTNNVRKNSSGQDAVDGDQQSKKEQYFHYTQNFRKENKLQMFLLLKIKDTLTTPDPPKCGFTHVYFKFITLIIFTVNNVIGTTLLYWAKKTPGPRFVESTFVFICEIQKAILNMFLVIGEERGVLLGLQAISRVIINEPKITMKIWVIAVVYTLQNNLALRAISKLDIAIYGVTSQLKVLTTAIFTIVILHRRLNLIQWLGLILLFAGISIVEIEKLKSKTRNEIVDPIFGFVAIFVASICSGFAGVYLEKILKNNNISLYVINVQLAIFSIILNLLVIVVFDRHKVKENGILYGYTDLVWISTIIRTIGGLLVGLVIKYGNTIVKSFASSVSVVIFCIIAVLCFNFQLTIPFTIGASLVAFSIIIYSNPELILSIPFFKLCFKDKPVHV